MKKSLGNLNQNIVATIIIIASTSYLLGFIFSLGALILEKNNENVRFYAKQTIIFSFIDFLIKSSYSFYNQSIILFIIRFLFLTVVFITGYHAYRNDKFIFPFIQKIIDYIKI